jgi:hypothetical protein
MLSELRKAVDGDSFRVRRLMVNPAISQNTNDFNINKKSLICWPNGFKVEKSFQWRLMIWYRLG